MGNPGEKSLETIEHQVEDEASYELESIVKCPHCAATLTSVNAVRLLRRKVNFTSSLPRRGYLVVCPACRGIVPATIVTWLG